jgi:hypothetical protein
VTWPFGTLTPLKYRVLLCDPPWYFRNYSAKGEEKNPVAHYDCMDLAAIKGLPVSQLAAPDCALDDCLAHAPALLNWKPHAFTVSIASGNIGAVAQHTRPDTIRNSQPLL